MSNPLLERHGWVSTAITNDQTMLNWGIWAQVSNSIADITITLPYTLATTPIGVTPLTQTAGSQLIMKMDTNPLFFVIVEGFSGTGGTNTINGSNTPITLKNQYDYVIVTNDNVGVDIKVTATGTLTLTQLAQLMLQKGGLITSDGTDLLSLPVGVNSKFLQADSTQTSGLLWATPPTQFDATVGIGGEYATVNLAFADSKKSIVIVGNATETTDIILMTDVSIQVNLGVIWDMGDFQIQYGVGVSFFLNVDGTIKWTPTISKSFIDGLGNGGVFIRDKFVLDGSASTIDNCPIYSNLTSAAGTGISQIFLPNQNGWGFHLDTNAIAFENGTIVFLNTSSSGSNIYNIFSHTSGFIKNTNNIILGGGFNSTISLITSIGAINSISILPISAPQSILVNIGGSLNSTSIPTGFGLNIVMIANNAQIINCNINFGNIDINGFTSIVLSNVTCNDILNITSDTVLNVVKRSIDLIPLIDNIQLYQNIDVITTTIGGITILNNGSSIIQQFIGSDSQTLQLPDATTLLNSKQYQIQNTSSGSIFITLSDTTALTTIISNSDILITLIDNLTTNGIWHIEPSGSSGTVTDVSIVSANGLAGTVATSTTTPTITLSTTVTGILKGDGTIISAAIATATPTANAIVEWDTNLNLSANNFLESLTTTVTTAGTTTLTIGSTGIQQFTGTSTQTVVLPNATTLSLGTQYQFQNESTGTLTINLNGGTLLTTISSGSDGIITLMTNSTAPGTWHIGVVGATGTSTPTANTVSEWDINKNMFANSFIPLNMATVTSPTPILLTSSSTQIQSFTSGTANQAVTLPNATTMSVGQSFIFVNPTQYSIVIFNSTPAGIGAIAPFSNGMAFLKDNSTVAGIWSISTLGDAQPPNLQTGSATLLTYDPFDIFTITTPNICTLPSASAAIGVPFTIVNSINSTANLSISGAVSSILLSPNQSAVVQSDGTYWNIIAQPNASSTIITYYSNIQTTVAIAASSIPIITTVNNTPTAANAFTWGTTPTVIGNITYNGTNGQWTLPANGTFELVANFPLTTGGSQNLVLQWVNLTNNVVLGSGCQLIGASGSQSNGSTIVAVITTTVSTQIQLQIIYNNGNGTIGENISPVNIPVNPNAVITQLNAQIGIVSTVQYLSVRMSSDFGMSTLNTAITFNNNVVGAIPFNTSTSVATLTAGLTYYLEAGCMLFGATGNGTSAFCFMDATSNINLTNFFPTLVNTSGVASSTQIGINAGFYTPSTNQNIKLGVTTTGTSGTQTVSIGGSYLMIVQTGVNTQSIVTVPTPLTIPAWDISSNLRANNLINSITSTVTAAGTTTLTASSTGIQRFTGTTTQTLVLPNATTLVNGTQYQFENESTGLLTIQTNGGTNLTILSSSANGMVTLASNGTSAGTWHVGSNPDGSSSGIRYSTANGVEIQTGDTWLSGQPVYRWITTFTNLTAGSFPIINATLTSSYVVNLISLKGMWKESAFTSPIILGGTGTGDIAAYCNGSGLGLSVGATRSSTNSGYVILEYTKI